ncbi:proline synthetase co-transcribed bacterial protein [Holotrichia oblita]|uniref:Proline synthetase co-transcribed bacterial protein n=1 Tax=Holotrichia oblita TaxID=644536 RepID=A0ACB9T3C8_HOLOL|nr:proline synthetase co-transcribed bacterial protein [Holotrichia oblita]
MLKTMSEINVKLGLKNVLTRIEEASKKRSPEFQGKTPQLVAVTKTKPVEMIIEAYNAGQRHFGENYVNELVEKANNKDILEKCKDIKWHFIGNLQTNKINKVLPLPNLYMIETIDDEKLAAKVNTNWPKYGNPDTKLNVMVQVNTSAEEAKNGTPPSNVVELSRFVLENCPNLRLHGLMTIGLFGYDLSNGPNPDFILLKQCRDKVCQELNIGTKDLELSMGMSDDFEHAIELGSTNIRVGSSIFGVRETKT